MIAVVVALAGVSLAVLGYAVWTTRRAGQLSDQLADARVAQVATEAELTLAQFQIESVKKALAAETARANAIEEIAHAIKDRPAVAPGDVDGWLLHFAARWREANHAPAGPDGDPAVPAEATTEAAGATLVHDAGSAGDVHVE